ncbi:MAG: hypothetical protein ABTD50_20675 [Polyangiaceae bacterium]
MATPASGLRESTPEASEGEAGAEPSVEGAGFAALSNAEGADPSVEPEFAGVSGELVQLAMANEDAVQRQRTMQDRLLMEAKTALRMPRELIEIALCGRVP